MRKLGSVVVLSVAPLLLLTACGGSSTPSASRTTTASSAPSSEAPSAPTSTGAAAANGTVIQVGQLPFDVTKYCGTKPMVVGILDAYGGNGWAQGKKALLTKLSKQCSNVSKVLYVDANLDLQKYIAGISSLVAQGANVIETFEAFGQAPIAAIAKARAAGVVVGSANAIPGKATVPADLDSNVIPDLQKEAEIWVKWLTAATNNAGKVAYIGGPAGNTFDVPSLAAVKKAIANQSSGIKIVTNEPVVGNWDPATTQQAMTGLLQKDKTINGVILSYTATGPAILRAYDAANVAYPAITGQSNSMEFVCSVGKALKKDPKFAAQSLDGSPNLHALDLARLFAAYQGVSAPELGAAKADTLVDYTGYVDTSAQKVPACDPTVPPSADLTTALPLPELKAAFTK